MCGVLSVLHTLPFHCKISAFGPRPTAHAIFAEATLIPARLASVRRGLGLRTFDQTCPFQRTVSVLSSGLSDEHAETQRVPTAHAFDPDCAATSLYDPANVAALLVTIDHRDPFQCISSVLGVGWKLLGQPYPPAEHHSPTAQASFADTTLTLNR
jgi:hypothetical protein